MKLARGGVVIHVNEWFDSTHDKAERMLDRKVSERQSAYVQEMKEKRRGRKIK